MMSKARPLGWSEIASWRTPPISRTSGKLVAMKSHSWFALGCSPDLEPFGPPPAGSAAIAVPLGTAVLPSLSRNVCNELISALLLEFREPVYPPPPMICSTSAAIASSPRAPRFLFRAVVIARMTGSLASRPAPTSSAVRLPLLANFDSSAAYCAYPPAPTPPIPPIPRGR
ncbi:Uncharacterised protein [Mycobacteroides abscessus subsp. abscessus]|nr:Uncharacterised protein [Mycobacteroides abscessus subsp. abscessus]